MVVLRAWGRCLSVILTQYVLLLVKTEAQSLEIRTEECSRIIGSPVEIIGKYKSLPGNPVDWQRQDKTRVGTCQPGVSCFSILPGYNIHQNNSGLDYTLLLTAASPVDEGLWQLLDGKTNLRTSLNFKLNLTAVNVNCTAFNTSSGYTGSVTCTTDCVEDDLDISYNILANLPIPQTKTSSTGCSGGEARYSSTIPLDSSHYSGISELCYILSSGNCNYTQTDDCTTVVIQSLTESTSTTELTAQTSLTTDVTFTTIAKSTASLTSDTPVSDNVVIGEPTTTTIPPTPTTTEASSPSSVVTSKTPSISTCCGPTTTCLPPAECDLIAVLVLACLLGLGSVIFLGILKKRGPKGSCRMGVIAILGTTALVTVVVIILVVLDLNDICFEILFLQRNSQNSSCTAESDLASASGISELGISGSVLFALDGVAFIVAMVIYCKDGENTEKPGNEVHMKARNAAP